MSAGRLAHADLDAVFLLFSNWTAPATRAHGRNALSFPIDKYRGDPEKPGTFVLPKSRTRTNVGTARAWPALRRAGQKKELAEASSMIAFAAIPQRNHGRSLRRFRREAREEIDGTLTRS
jgi:hypothetical protein